MEEDVIEEEDKEEAGREVDLWGNATVLLIVQIGPRFVVSGDFAKVQVNQMETLILGSVDQVLTVPLGPQNAPATAIVNLVVAVVVVAGVYLVVENVERESQDSSQGL